MKIIIAGGREFFDRNLLFTVMDKAFGGVTDKIEAIISGHARGADKLGEEWARSRGLADKLIVMAAEWEKHGKAAGPIRNVEMSLIATHVIVFWDGKSSGSRHMWMTGIEKGLWVKVVRY